MKIRSLRRKKKTEDKTIGGGLLAVITTPMKSNNNSNRNNNTLQQKGFRRRIPSQVVVTSPFSRFRNNTTSSCNSSRAMSGLTEEEEDTTTAQGDRLMFVTPEKNPPPCSWAAVTRVSNSSFTTTTSATTQLEQIGLVGSVQEWVDAMGCLLNSQEFQRLLHTSGHLMLSAGGAAVRTVCLPVTVPLHVANHTTRFVVGHVVLPILGVTQLLLQQPDATTTTTPTRQSVREDEDTPDKENEHHPKNPISKVVRGVWCLPGHVVGLADHVKNEIGGVVLRTLAPPLHGTIQESCSAGEPTSEAAQNHAHVLERLRLDYGLDPAEETTTTTKEPVKTSQFLLRIDDLRVMDEEKSSLLHYVDLNALEHPFVLHALDRMVHVGLSLIANHPTVRLSNRPHLVPREQEIEWKPEGSTFKLLRRLSKLDVLGRLDMLRKETLVWSGHFQNDVQADYDRQSRFYLARGVLNMSPRALLDLLWDNSRTSEYNKYCLGRTTFFGNDLEFLQGLDKTGTKVIQSETRVPLTSISVTVKCLMHARALPDNSGYIIISRSCNTGPQGVHHEPLKNVSRPKNEIHWGVNILRRVPNREDCVDLTSHSQVGTAGVPQFLAAKIALMGVEGFFENSRKLAR